jgi:hypothetical protein
MEDLINNLTPEQALTIVRRLAERNEQLRETILAEARALLDDVDVDEVAEDVFSDLECIPVEEAWDRSENDRFGYVTPEEAAYEMVEEELAAYVEQVRQYHQLGMDSQARMYCMGILQGLYRFDMESESEFRKWAEDVALDFFGTVFEEWKKSAKDKASRSELAAFIRKACPDWADEVLKYEN